MVGATCLLGTPLLDFDAQLSDLSAISSEPEAESNKSTLIALLLYVK